jgi:hypothetical protein
MAFKMAVLCLVMRSMDLCLFDNALSFSSTQGDSMPLSPQTSKSKLQAYSATSVLTTTASDAVSNRPKAPLPGRSIKLGLQVFF